ncbi:unnamed protein product [Brachionus calyciflorus]|uniref:Uncharacterized protein n=1 Tax=Brachionus calyciflorus TaxID=104777 RepID=A0A813Z9D9_9BILA|nr:unnamed protein product [Brachionus calyciflorus]
MYTRFKNQKSGLKLGLNTIVNNRKVVIPISSNLASSVCSSISTSSSNQSLNSTDYVNTSAKISGDTSPLHSPSPSILNSVLTVSSVLIDDNQTNENSLNGINKSDISPAENPIIPFLLKSQYNDDGANIVTKSNFTSHRKREKNNLNGEPIDEPIDLTCVSYVKSVWDKYSDEIGTQNGPLRHVDENNQYPHLNGFVAFDMEHWWAERSISTMMNNKDEDKKQLSKNESNKNNNILFNDNETLFRSAIKKSSYKIANGSQSTKFHNYNLSFS